MDITSLHIHRALTTQLVMLFCLAWPFLAFALIRRSERSSAPVTAMLIPLAIALAETWLAIVRVLTGMALSGGGTSWIAAGIAEALRTMVFGAISATFVALVALLRRHRPLLDPPSAILVALWIAVANAALFGKYASVLPFVGASAAFVIAIAAFAWLFLVSRRRMTSRPVPFGVPVAAATVILLLFLVWQRATFYIAMAMAGQS